MRERLVNKALFVKERFVPQVGFNDKHQKMIIWRWFDEFLLCGKHSASGKGRRDGVIDGCAKLKPSIVTTLLKKQQAHANVSFHHKRHLGRGASTRAASDLGASERDKLKQGRWSAADAMGASYDYSLPNVSEQNWVNPPNRKVDALCKPN